VIWLLRHGDAEDGPDDFARQLTEKGRRQSTSAGRALASLGVKIDACLSSPRVRAVETARLACEALRVEVEEVEALQGGDFDPEDLAAGRGEVLLIGHEPDFSRAIAAVTGGRVKMKKGGLAGIEDGELRVLLRPVELERIAA
jgi:phosphohistidine phosphatase